MRLAPPPLTLRERRALMGLFWAAGLGGLRMAAVVILSNQILHSESNLNRALGGLAIFGLMVWMVLVNKRYLPRHTGALIAQISARRVALADRLRATPLRVVERNPELVNAAAAELDYIDQIPDLLTTIGYRTATIGLSTLYIARLSTVGLAVWLGIVTLMVMHHRRVRAQIAQVVPNLTRARRGLDHSLRMRLFGHAQLHHDARARAESREDLMRQEGAGGKAQERLNLTQGGGLAWGEDVLLLGLGLILFRTTHISDLDLSTRFKLVTTILSISGMTLGLVGLMMQFQLVAAAYGRLQQVEALLAPAPGPAPTREPRPAGPALRLELDRLGYVYDGEGFAVGPVSLKVKGGELVVIRGGNGSGKTTLMRVLAGLYTATGGTLRLCGEAIGAENLAWYQSHITAIFTNQHLFDEPFGLEGRLDEAAALLERFGLSAVVRLEGGRFSRTSLSSGQRKRLAMVVALLERRPVLIFDEWDSHQDPGQRSYYYDVLLPELKAQGRIVFAVSHDARRFHQADHLLHLDGGRMVAAADGPAVSADPPGDPED